MLSVLALLQAIHHLGESQEVPDVAGAHVQQDLVLAQHLVHFLEVVLGHIHFQVQLFQERLIPAAARVHQMYLHFGLEQDVELESVLAVLEELLVLLDLLESLDFVVAQLDLENRDDGLEVFVVVNEEDVDGCDPDVEVDGVGRVVLVASLLDGVGLGLFTLDLFEETLEQEYLGRLHHEYLVVLQREANLESSLFLGGLQL